MAELLSIIVPIHNAEPYLRQCLDSICSQSYEDLQIILVNDGSDDRSLNICEEYQKKDQRIEVYSQENQGVSAARNLGLKKAKGELIAFVDADDYLDVNAYEKAIGHLEDCDAVFFGYVERYDEAQHSKVISPDKGGIVNRDEAIYQCLRPLGYEVAIWNKVFRRKAIGEHRFDTGLKISEDELWLMQVLKDMEHVSLYPEPLYYYVQRQGSTMRSVYEVSEKWHTAYQAKSAVVELLKDTGLSEMSKAKIFHDLFHLRWYSYISDDKENGTYFKEKLAPYERAYYRSKEFTFRRKVKYMLMTLMMKCHCPAAWVEKLGDTTSYKVALSVKEGKKL